MNNRKSNFWAGLRAETPILIGGFPEGVIYGALALASGLTAGQSQMMSSMLYAGSAQFIAVQLFHEAAPGFVIVLTIAVVNLRHMLYSASLAPYVSSLPMRWKVLLSYLLTDEVYAPTIIHYENEGANSYSHWFYLAAGFSLWFTWQVSTALGIFLGSSIPESLPLAFALPLTFIAMVIPALKTRPAVVSAISAGITALATFSMPYKLGLIVAGMVGIAVGTYLEARQTREETV